ncbi:HEPN domain-containing protein [Kitasatospora cineracea]|uniref:HEPN domain-containing protein n=1 Tax=Kitasatospora cineracea TaxID=88074 RepID=UPI003678CECD
MSGQPKPVELLYRDQRQILDALQLSEPSFHTSLQAMLPKVLMLAAASEFEHYVCGYIREYVAEVSTGNRVGFLVERKAISRQYHTFFDWPNRKAGSFWALFGPAFKKAAELEVSEKDKLREGLAAFLEVGAVRNLLIHNNYADVTINTTLDEVYALYVKGWDFVSHLPQLLRISIPDEEEVD